MGMKPQRLYLYLLLFSTILIGLMFAYYSLTSDTATNRVIGEIFVENEIPPPDLFPLFTKPATILSVLIIISWYSIVGLVKEKVYSISYTSKMLVRLIFVITTIISLYELLFNFMLWALLIMMQDGSTINPDKAINVFPTDRYPVNMVFATKIAVVTFGCSAYALATFWNVKRNEDVQSASPNS